LANCFGKQCIAIENPCVFRKKAENQSGKEMMEVLSPFIAIPVRIVSQQFDVQPVQSPRRLDVESALRTAFLNNQKYFGRWHRWIPMNWSGLRNVLLWTKSMLLFESPSEAKRVLILNNALADCQISECSHVSPRVGLSRMKQRFPIYTTRM